MSSKPLEVRVPITELSTLLEKIRPILVTIPLYKLPCHLDTTWFGGKWTNSKSSKNQSWKTAPWSGYRNKIWKVKLTLWKNISIGKNSPRYSKRIPRSSAFSDRNSRRILLSLCLLANINFSCRPTSKCELMTEEFLNTNSSQISPQKSSRLCLFTT